MGQVAINSSHPKLSNELSHIKIHPQQVTFPEGGRFSGRDIIDPTFDEEHDGGSGASKFGTFEKILFFPIVKALSLSTLRIFPT